jgi:hypothetical protein
VARDVGALLDRQRVFVEGQVGEPIIAIIPGLAASGTTGAVIATMSDTAFGGFEGDRRHDEADAAGGDAAVFEKNRYALLTITPAGRVKLYRTKMSRKGPKVEQLVGDWSRDEISIDITRTAMRLVVALVPAAGPRYAFEMVDVFGASDILEPFATAAGITSGPAHSARPGMPEPSGVDGKDDDEPGQAPR